jgi:hypothetical protein
MDYWVEDCTGYVLEAWQNATPAHYLPLALGIVLVGWYMRRFSGQ